jgi:hypothetical protein
MAQRSAIPKATPFWLVAMLAGGFLAATGIAIAVFVISEDRGQARITTPEPACASSVLASLQALQRQREFGFSAHEDHAAALVDTGQVVIEYEVGATWHEAAFRVEADDAGGCSLVLHLEEAWAEGALSNRRRGRLASIAVPGCSCEARPR